MVAVLKSGNSLPIHEKIPKNVYFVPVTSTLQFVFVFYNIFFFAFNFSSFFVCGEIWENKGNNFWLEICMWFPYTQHRVKYRKYSIVLWSPFLRVFLLIIGLTRVASCFTCFSFVCAQNGISITAHWIYLSSFLLAKCGNSVSYAGGLSSLSSACGADGRCDCDADGVELSPGVLNAVDRTLFERWLLPFVEPLTMEPV